MIKKMTGLKENLFIKEILKIKIIFFILFFIFSCQPVEVLDEVIFEYNQLPKISINAKEKLINEVYEINYVDPYIDHSIKNPPILRLKDWISQNISIFGSQNKLIINIVDASLKKTEKENKNKKKYQEKTEFFYEIHFLIKFELYDEAASYFKKSNIIKNDNLNYDINRHLKQFKALSELFLPDFVTRLINSG